MEEEYKSFLFSSLVDLTAFGLVTTRSTRYLHLMAARLNKELKDALEKGWDIEPSDDLRQWDVVFRGPQACGSPYEDGSWIVNITFPIEYPFKPPKVVFSSKIFHPNVTEKGEICTKTIEDDWSPRKTLLTAVLPYVESLLSAPDLGNPMNAEAAALMQTDRKAFDKKVSKQIRNHQ